MESNDNDGMDFNAKVTDRTHAQWRHLVDMMGSVEDETTIPKWFRSMLDKAKARRYITEKNVIRLQVGAYKMQLKQLRDQARKENAKAKKEERAVKAKAKEEARAVKAREVKARKSTKVRKSTNVPKSTGACAEVTFPCHLGQHKRRFVLIRGKVVYVD